MAITNGYLTLEEARAFIGQASENVTVALEETIQAVSRLIDLHCQRHFWQTSSTSRTFAADQPYMLHLGAYNDLVSASAVALDSAGDGTFETTLSAGQYQLLTINGGFNPSASPEQRPYESLRSLGVRLPTSRSLTGRDDRVRITGVWGWPAVPSLVKEACKIQVHRVYKRTDSPFGVAGFGEFGVVRLSRLDPDVQEMLKGYRRFGGMVVA